jgi:hypothetical protein
MKKKITLTLCFISTILFSQVPNYVPTIGLVGWWPFTGNANDLGANGNNGVVNQAILSTDRFGNINNSYSFNRSIANEINIGNSTSLNTISNITISLWLKLSSYGAFNQSGYNHYINKSDQSNNHQFVFANNNTELYFYFSGGSNYFATNNLPPLNQWANVVVTYQYDGSPQNSFCKFYINGILVNTILTTQTLNLSNYNLKIGNFGSNFYNRHDGQLDDIGIWNRALTQQEITNLYNASLSTEDFAINEVTIYPNPTTTLLNFKSAVQVEKILIYNMLGQLVQQEKVNALEGTINIEKLAQGNYLVKVNDIAKGYTIIKN